MILLDEIFSMFADVIKKDYDNKLTETMKKNINEYKERLKDYNFEQSSKYLPFCLELDKQFEEFINSYE